MSKQSKARPRTTPARVRELLAQNQHGSALNDAIWLQENEPSSESALCYQETLLEAAMRYAQAEDSIAFHKVLGRIELVKVSPLLHWNSSVSILYAIAGDRAKAIAKLGDSADPATLAKIDGHIADISVVRDRTDLIPPGHEAGHKAIATAFDYYSGGQDEQAREALNAVGLQSPYLDWKLLIRGLMAWSTGDDARAIENFQRLAKDRKCIRLCTGIRSQIDKPWAETLPQESFKRLNSQYARLTTNPTLKALKVLRDETQVPKLTLRVWKSVEQELPVIRKQSPALIPKLQEIFYNFVLRRGQPDDMKPFLKHFGPPPFDPELHELQARAWEAALDIKQAVRFWEKYVRWLETVKQPLPVNVVRRMCADVYCAMANMEYDLEHQAGDIESILMDAFGPSAGKKKPSKKTYLEHYRKSIQLAPDWLKPVSQLSLLTLTARNVDESSSVLEEYVTRNPGDEKAVMMLARHYRLMGRYDLALPYFLKYLNLKAFDKEAIGNASECGILATVESIRNRDWGLYGEYIQKYEEFLGAQRTQDFFCVRLIYALMRKRPSDAGAFEEMLAIEHSDKLSKLFFLSLYGSYVGLKPADVNRYRKPFEAMLKEPLSLTELNAALDKLPGSVDAECEMPVSKKLLAAVTKVDVSVDDESECETTLSILLDLHADPTIKKLLTKWRRIFPMNPFVLIADGEVTKLKKGRFAIHDARRLFGRALMVVQTTPRYTDLEDRILKLIQDLDDEIDNSVDGDYFF